MSCFPCQIRHSTSGASGPTAFSRVPELITLKEVRLERMHVAQRVYVTPHVFWTVGRLCVSVGDQLVMEFLGQEHDCPTAWA